ncbi:ABC transporter substrate-binding protein [Clostridium thermarum]|uniref:ABC transporter substrate-binding protein n=1 Tax=Clostridium thermarum TaxID=1716543 RepID=UPI0013D7BCE3|nr:extracellular solute-binding protein [Clostridium thermarum]
MLKKSFIYRCAVTTLILIFVTGCTGNEVIDEVIGTEKTLKGDISIWSGEETKGTIENAVRLFVKENPEVKISVTAVPTEELKNRLKTSVASKEGVPDIVEVSTYAIPVFIHELPDIFRPVDKDMEKIKSMVVPWKLKEVTIGEQLYGFPWDVNPRVLLYNRELADKYNLEPFQAKTWNEFIQMGMKLKERSQGTVKLIALNETENGNLYISMLRQLKKPLYSQDKGLVLPLEENKLALSTINELVNQQLVYNLQSSEDPVKLLQSEKALCIIADNRSINKLYNSEEFNDTQWQAEPFPAFEFGGKRSANGEGTAFIMTKHNEGNQVASEFLRFMLTDNESNIFGLKQAGIIPAVTELYSLPMFNGSIDNFMGLKLWRLMAEQGREEVEIVYDKDYPTLVSELINLEQEAIAGGDIEDLIIGIETEYKDNSFD